MASRQSTVDFIVEQLGDAGAVSARKMFGEYAIYLGDVLVALVCDDQLFIKPTAGGRALTKDCKDAPPYAGAKPSILIPEERLEDAAWLCQVVAVTAAELPPPKPKKPKRSS